MMYGATDAAHRPLRILSRDTQATLLLVARLGDKPRIPPLNRREYNAVATALVQQDLRPGDLLSEGVLDRLRLDPRVTPLERLRFLLGRTSALAIAVDGWINAGLWVIGRGDPEYPRRIRRTLRGESPPLLFGAGSIELMRRDGIGVVGSRDVDHAGSGFARRLGRLCAAQDLTVISGAARGVDSEAMLAAAECGGGSVGILAGDLERQTLAKTWRGLIRDGRVTLMSPFEPAARFTIGYAMERNRYVYTMSRFVVVVASASGKGGTWAGAVENWEAGWSPLVVRADEGTPPGNVALLKRGATPLRGEDLEHRADLRALYHQAAEQQRSRGGADVEALELPLGASNALLPSIPTPPESASAAGMGALNDSLLESRAHLEEARVTDNDVVDESSNGASFVDVFGLIRPHIEAATASPQTLDELTNWFPGVLKSQLKAWLARAASEGYVRCIGRPPRYVRR